MGEQHQVGLEHHLAQDSTKKKKKVKVTTTTASSAILPVDTILNGKEHLS